MNKKVALSVTNDLISDQRVHKVCLSLQKWGYDVLLIGRLKHNSPSLEKRPYAITHMRLLFEKGPLFYAEYNLRLFFYLLFSKTDILIANDLDTLLANYLVSKIKNQKLVYDSHEYFTEVPELISRKFTQSIWKRIERYVFPKLKNVYTVNESIAELYFSEYGIKPSVVRNFPLYDDTDRVYKSKNEIGLPEGKKIILYQGAINIDRGLPEAIEAMQYVNNAILVIIGDGDILYKLKEDVRLNKLNEKILFVERLPLEKLKQYTIHADIGISLEKNTNLNYRYALPNKIFDYIHAGIPVLTSALEEVKKVFSQYEIGVMINNHDPKHIAEKINSMLNDESKKNKWKQNCIIASKIFCWQNEEKVLSDLLMAV